MQALRTKALLDAIHKQLLLVFENTPDRGEKWTMPPVDFDGRQIIKDDCDGYCLAARVLLRKQGIPSRLVYCVTPAGGHLVVEVNGWILDNTQRHVMPNSLLRSLGYRFKRISGFESGEPWREIIA